MLAIKGSMDGAQSIASKRTLANHKTASRVGALTRDGAASRVRKLALIASCLMVLVMFCSCRPTDFFTEIIISPFADEVDENNPEKTIVNSPDAEEESDQLAALDWSDDAVRSEEVQNLVTYSDQPTSTLLTHHSIFDLNPRFPGVKSSDAVTLDYSVPSTVENETSSQPQQSDGSADDTALEGAEATNQGTDSQIGASDDGEVQEENDTEGEGEGQTGDPTAGMDGDVDVYDPNNAFSEVKHADHLAATGQAAVMVQALGGQGALCAIDENTYYGTGDTTSNFADVFGDELPSDFEQTAILWEGSGSVSSQVVDIEALVEACGQDGVLVYDQSEGSYDTRFDLEQRKWLQLYNIQLVPVDFSSVQGMIDAAAVIGDALSESSCAQDAKQNADAYAQRISSIVSAVAGSQNGSLAAKDESVSGSRLLSDYNSCPIRSYTSNHLFTAFGVQYISGIAYSNGSYALDTTHGLLFTRIDNSSPLSFWAQAAGVWDRAADLSESDTSPYAMIYGINSGAYYDERFFYMDSGGTSVVLASTSKRITLSTQDSTTDPSSSAGRTGDGLGSGAFPYLIVGASNGQTAQKVKESVVAQIDSNSPINAYSALPWVGNSFGKDDGNGNLIEGFVGSTNGQQNAILDQGVSANDIVRANPVGLLGSWTDGSMESVLEAAWLARVYSDAPANCDYSPICNYSVSKLSETVQSFYRDFYRLDNTAAAYDSVVVDEGL